MIQRVAFILPKIALEYQVSLAINLMSICHHVPTPRDRYYVLLVCNWILVHASLQLLRSKQTSTLFMLFSEQWFIALWNDMSDEENDSMPIRYKEELCLSLLEAALMIRAEVGPSDEWMLASVEAAEICSKVLDWKMKTSVIGEQVCLTYLVYLEEVLMELKRASAMEETESEQRIRTRDYMRKV